MPGAAVCGSRSLSLFFSMLTVFVLNVQGDLIIRQVPTNGGPSWVIRGLATYEYEGSNPTIYHFHCTSTINDGNQVIWRRKDGVSLTKTQVSITYGVAMEFTLPVAGDAGLYVCVDGQSNEEVEITITPENPAAAAVTSSLTHYLGENAVINMYASALAPIEDNQIQWRLNGVAIIDEIFTNDKTSLVINNISPNDAGVYQMIVTIGNQMTANSSTKLIVLGSSQVCSVDRGLAIIGNTDIQVDISMPDPVCIRCGYLDATFTVVLVTDTDDVTYTTGGNVIVNTTDISVTDDGLILNNPGNTFSDGTRIVCTFNQPGNGQVSHTFTIEHLVNNPPTLSPDGGDDKTVNVTEGSNITLTCTRDSNNAPGDLYQWIHPNGQMTPGVSADSPVQLTLRSITREESGVYICQGSRNGIIDSALRSYMTLSVQHSDLQQCPGHSSLLCKEKRICRAVQLRVKILPSMYQAAIDVQ